MIIFINEDRAYASWLTRHRQGFVAQWLRRPTRKKPVLHRAACAEIRPSGTKSHWTTGRHIKACSLDLGELKAWVDGEVSDRALYCEHCRPDAVATGQEERTLAPTVHDHLTKLEREIVDCVLDAAVVSLDTSDFAYSLAVADVAGLVGKTPVQMIEAFLRLIAEEYIVLDEDSQPGTALAVDRHVYPTAKALRILPAFRTLKAHDLEEELRGLYSAGT